MNNKLLILLLVASVAAFGQGHSTGHPAGSPSGMGGTGGAKSGSAEAHAPTSAKLSHSSPEQLLAKNSQLSSRLQKLLPQDMTPQQACSGFKNLGQCVAAIHVAHNLGIPFADLKSKMTGSGSMSLGKAVSELKPATNAKAEVKKARKQTVSDLKETSS